MEGQAGVTRLFIASLKYNQVLIRTAYNRLLIL